MGTLRKMWRKMRRWFDRKGRSQLKEVKNLVKKAFMDMTIDVSDLFDQDARELIADEIKKRVKKLRSDITDWLIEWAMETLWEEVRDGFYRSK